MSSIIIRQHLSRIGVILRGLLPTKDDIATLAALPAIVTHRSAPITCWELASSRLLPMV